MDNYFSRYVHSALAGDEAAYETLYNLTKDALFFAVLNITKNDPDALNIMKESYTQAFENLTTLDKPEIFDIWLNRIAFYSVYMFISEKNPTAFSNISENFDWSDEDNYDKLPQETIDDKDTRNIVKGIIENLSDAQRLLIVMHYYQEMSVSAIASTIDLPENTIMCILSSAREEIKKEIAKAESEGKLMRSISLAAVPYILMELAKSQFLFHPAPPMSNIIPSKTDPEPIIEEKNDIQEVLNIPSPIEPESQQQNIETQEPIIQPPVQEFQPEYTNPYEQQAPVQGVQQEYTNPYEQQAPVQGVQQEYINPYEQQAPVQEVQQEYTNPYEQQASVQGVKQEYTNPYEQQVPVQGVQSEYTNPYEQQVPVQEVQPKYTNPYEQQAPVQAVAQQPKNNAPSKPQSYKRTLESNFSVDTAPKKKNKKQKNANKQNSSFAKVGKFLKSTAGIATIAGVAFVVVAGVVLFYVSEAAKKSSITTDGMVETSYNLPTTSEESSHEPTSEELRAAELKADEDNYVYKDYPNGTVHVIGYNGKLEDIVIPETYLNKKVTGIDPAAFKGCSQIKSVTISKNIQSISLEGSDISFSNEDFSNLYNPFYDCIYMKNIYVDDANKYFSSVDGVLYNKDITKLLFYPTYKSDKTYTVPNSVTEIGVCAFQRNGIVTEITLPKGLNTIGGDAFYECTSLKKIEIPSGVTEINESLFLGCKALENVVLPDSIKEIKSNAFYRCSCLREITIPKSVEKLGSGAFSRCTMLNTCTIENSNMTFQNSSSNKEESIFTNTQVTLRAKSGSTAEKYAKKWNIYFSYM